MAGAITDLLDRVSDSNTGRPIIATLASPGKALGAASINLSAATNWTVESAIHFSIYETTTVGSTIIKDTTTQTDWKSTLSGTTISNLTITGGTDRAYTAGAIAELTPTARYAKDMYDWATVGHNKNGTHKVFTETAIVPTAAMQDEAVTPAKRSGGFSGGSFIQTANAAKVVTATGFDFTPKFLEFEAAFNHSAAPSNQGSSCSGWYNVATGEYGVVSTAVRADGGAGSYLSTNRAIRVLTVSGTGVGAEAGQATVSATGSGTFTLNFTNIDTNVGLQVLWKALG